MGCWIKTHRGMYWGIEGREGRTGIALGSWKWPSSFRLRVERTASNQPSFPPHLPTPTNTTQPHVLNKQTRNQQTYTQPNTTNRPYLLLGQWTQYPLHTFNPPRSPARPEDVIPAPYVHKHFFAGAESGADVLLGVDGLADADCER